MKKNVYLILAVSATTLISQSTKADLLAGWTFESSGLGSSTPNYLPGANTSTTNFYAEAGTDLGTATAIGHHAGAATYTSPAGDGSAKSLSSALWALGDYYQFSIPLNSAATYSAFSVTYDQNGSATGPGTFEFAYSTDGTSWTQVGNDYALTSGVTWNTSASQATHLSFDLSMVPSLISYQGSEIYFRIIDDSTTAINGTTVGTGGTDRVDNFSVIATVPEPSIIALATVGGLATLVALRRRR